jgi:hypothetical protein
MKNLSAALVLLAVAFPAGALAGTEEEISHLLRHIEKSDCLFVRNGKEHGSREALEHIQRKYDHVRNRVETAEDFIEYAATKSSMTGKAYQVLCGSEEIPTADWLHAELAGFRQEGGRETNHGAGSSPGSFDHAGRHQPP